ncbi:hypothetical protein BC826DRAFT_590767 [Russula brevipes]|nr:hypothetical protein BC826DRAFT_590767 [Russula brevipes]
MPSELLEAEGDAGGVGEWYLDIDKIELYWKPYVKAAYCLLALLRYSACCSGLSSSAAIASTSLDPCIPICKHGGGE